MPGTMIHLLFALKIDDNATTEFYIGNIAPDSLEERVGYHYEDKNRLHFRGSDDRMNDVLKLAKSVDIHDPYCKGYISHLFLDFYYDNDIINAIKSKKGAGFFDFYRVERDKSSSFMYHNEPAIRQLWDRIMDYDVHIDKNIQGILQEDITINKNRIDTWYKEHNFSESTELPQAFLHDYLDQIKEKYILWIDRNNQ